MPLLSYKMRALVLALAVPLYAVPTAAFVPHATRFLRASALAQARATAPLRRPLAVAQRGFRSSSMSLLDSLKGLAGATKSYDDLKPGSFAEETANYAKAGEVKAKTADGSAIATFGGGCFWGVELAFQRVPGVIETCVGYTQGKIEHPSYELVCTGMSGHTEVVQLKYDPSKCDFKDLTRLLFSRINPKLKDQVGNDRGTQYRHGVYYHTPEQKKAAEEVFEEILAADGGPIYTELCEAKVYYPAEGYHQQYLEKGGRAGNKQSAAKGCNDPIRCYG